MDINEMIAAVKACERGEKIALDGDASAIPAVLRSIKEDCYGRVKIVPQGKHSPRYRRVRDTAGLLKTLCAACPPRDRVPAKYTTPSLFTDAVAVSDGVGAVFCPVYDYIDKTAWAKGGMDGMIGNSPYRYVMPEFYDPLCFAVAHNGGAFMGRLACASEAYSMLSRADWCDLEDTNTLALVNVGDNFYNPKALHSVMVALFKCGATTLKLHDGGKRFAPLIIKSDVEGLYGLLMPMRTECITPRSWFYCGTDEDVRVEIAA